MLNSIVQRHSRSKPLNQTGIKVISSAVRLFLQEGFDRTTFKMIEEDSGVRSGTINYYFRTKEDMLSYLIEELMDYHANVLEEMQEKLQDNLLAYAMEIALQIALCENNRNAWELYYAGYDHPETYELIKIWAAEKNYSLLKDRLPEWEEHNFREKEIVASGIEFAALKTYCDRYFTLEKKISVILDSIMMLYHVPTEERERIIGRILEMDFESIAQEMFGKFVSRLDNDAG